MNIRFKKILGIVATVTFLLVFSRVAFADSNASLWKLVSGKLVPIKSTWNLKIPALGGSGTTCLQSDNTGVISVTGSGCGGGGGSTVKVSATDTTADYLSNKITVADNTIVLGVSNPLGNEVLTVAVDTTKDMEWLEDQSFLSTGGILLPNGQTSERPSTGAGYLRYNTESLFLEYLNGENAWNELATTSLFSSYIPISGLSTGANFNNQTVSNLGSLTITPASLTGSSATKAFDLQQTWNTSGTPTLLFSNVTDTASNSNSLFLDLQKNAVSQFKVNKSGQGTINQLTMGSITIGSNSISPSVNGFNLLSSGRTWNFSNSATTNYYLKINESSSTATSGTLSPVTLSTAFAPTSGTAVMNGITFDSVINQTGGASGITRGAYFNPTLTASADFRAIEVATGKSLFRDIKLTTAGDGIYIKEGTNATSGIATLVAGTVTVSTTKVTANSRIYLTRQTTSGTLGTSVDVTARTAGTSFTITSNGSVLDTSTVAWFIIEPS